MSPPRSPLKLPLFAAHSVWNRGVACNAPVHKASSDRVVFMHNAVVADPLRGGVTSCYVNCEEWSIPVYQAQGHTTSALRLETYDGQHWGLRSDVFEPDWRTERRRDGSEVDVAYVPGVLQPGRAVNPAYPACVSSDGSLVLLDENGRHAYDFFQARVHERALGGLLGHHIVSAGAVARWELAADGSAFAQNEPRDAARASGLPLLGGLLLPESLLYPGGIPHALAASFPALRYIPCRDADGQDRGVRVCEGQPPNWVHPASRTESSGGTSTDPLAIAAGERLRLRSTVYADDGSVFWTDGVQVAGRPPVLELFMRALRDHGLIAADASGGWVVYAEAPETARGVAAMTKEQVEFLANREMPTPQESDQHLTPWRWLMEQLRGLLCGNLSLAVRRGDRTVPNFEILASGEADG